MHEVGKGSWKDSLVGKKFPSSCLCIKTFQLNDLSNCASQQYVSRENMYEAEKLSSKDRKVGTSASKLDRFRCKWKD